MTTSKQDKTEAEDDGGVVIRFHRGNPSHPHLGIGLEIVTYGTPEPNRDEVIDALRRALRLYGADPS